MPRTHHPRRGSLGYYPRKRAKRIYARVKSRPNSKEAKIVEFAGYKVGMTHVTMINDKKDSKTQNQEISVPVTILETPPLKVAGIRIYQQTIEGLRALKECWTTELNKELERKTKGSKKSKIDDLKKEIDKIKEVRLIVHTNPSKAGINKKKPELFEITSTGENIEEKLKLAEDKLGKEISVSEVFKDGDFIDTIGITKGKGFQGVIKRFGVKLQDRKTDKKKRMVGNLGPWTPKKISWRIPREGQMGYHRRTELNKRILKIGEKPEDIRLRGGWLNYGVIKSSYVIIKGSVQGSSKRLIRFRSVIRPRKKKYGVPEVTHISLESKQGV